MSTSALCNVSILIVLDEKNVLLWLFSSPVVLILVLIVLLAVNLWTMFQAVQKLGGYELVSAYTIRSEVHSPTGSSVSAGEAGRRILQISQPATKHVFYLVRALSRFHVQPE